MKLGSFLKNICMQMYEYDAQIFRSLIRHKDFKGRSKRIISDTDENMRVPQKIAEGIYLEMNLSANEALNYAKLVIENFNFEQFYLIDNNIAIFYQQYDIAPYSSGIPVFYISSKNA